MKNFMSKVFSWKTIRRTAIGGFAVATVFSLLSSVAGIAAIPTVVAAGLSTAITIGAVGAAGLGVVGTAVAVGKGAVNGLRYIFSKSYRNQVRQNRLNKKNKNKVNENVNVNEQTLAKEKTRKPNIFKRFFNKLFNRNKNKQNVVEEPKVIEEPKVVEEPEAVEETKVVEEPIKVNPSRKASGFYDKLSDDNKNLYDTIVSKNKPSVLFDGLSADQARVLKETYSDSIKEYRAIAKTRDLTDEEQKEVLHAVALRTKINAYIRKKDEAAKENAFENNGEEKRATIEAVANRIKR